MRVVRGCEARWGRVDKGVLRTDHQNMARGHQSLVVIAILAAGASSRMRGGDKLLEMVQGEPMLRRQARLALQTGAPVIVTLPTDRPDRNLALAGLDVQVIGVPDAEMGEQVKAVVQLRDGIAPTDALARELIDFCRERIAHFKCPRSVDFSAQLPRSAAGKLMKRELKAKYQRM